LSYRPAPVVKPGILGAVARRCKLHLCFVT